MKKEKKDIDKILQIARFFGFNFDKITLNEISIGHIHSTYEVNHKLFLQKFNVDVFPNLKKVQANYLKIYNHLKNSDYPYQLAKPLKGLDYICTDQNGFKWRAFEMIKDSCCLFNPFNSQQVYEASFAFATFQKFLQSLTDLQDPISGFMNNKKRFKDFNNTLKLAMPNKVKESKGLIDLILENKDFFGIIDSTKNSFNSLRPTHGDMKLNNLLFNLTQEKVKAVIDLDTCMNGNYLFDYADFLRTACSNLPEDSSDLVNLQINFDYYQSAISGFKDAFYSALPSLIWDLIPKATAEMCLTVGTRFLTDYLEDNKYFKVNYPKHNLVRARNQITLFKLWKNFKQ